MFNLRAKDVYRLSYLYLTLPLLLFTALWVDVIWGIFFTGFTVFILYKSLVSVQSSDSTSISSSTLIMLGGIALLWCFLSGIGYFYYQSFDYHFRNAVFRDLIFYNWPVFYPNADTPMVYYMGFWLPAAFCTKFLALFLSDAFSLFIIANVFLFIYATCGILLIFAHLILLSKAQTLKNILGIVLLFIFFSGLDALGFLIVRPKIYPFEYHLEWWDGLMQYSSMTTLLFWVFNQFIPIALLTLLLYGERNIKNFGLLGLLAVYFAPYPAISYGILLITYAFSRFILSADKIFFLKTDIFSLQNILIVALILPFIILYYSTNSNGIVKLYPFSSYATIMSYLIFVVIEFLGYAVLFYGTNKKNIFFWTSCLLLILIPFIRLDEQNNFCMRVSVPPLILFAIFAIQYAQKLCADKKNSVRAVIFSLMILCGACTGLTEFYRGFVYTSRAHKIDLVADEIYTLNRPVLYMPIFYYRINHQFTAANYKNDIFWSIFAPHSLKLK